MKYINKGGKSKKIKLQIFSCFIKQFFLPLSVLCFPFLSSAASELSNWTLFTQAFNFSLFFSALFFLVKKPIQVLFHKRKKEFFAFEKQAFEWEKQKKEENKLWLEKISDLNEKEKNIKEKAKTEGDRFKEQKQQELKELEKSLKAYCEFLIHLETEKMKKRLLIYWKKQLIQSAKKELEEQALSPDFQEKEAKAFLNFLGAADIEKELKVEF